MINILKWIGFIFMWFVVCGCIAIVAEIWFSLFNIELNPWVISAIGVTWTSLIADDLAYACKV